MVKKVIWTPEAESSFEGIIQYLEQNWTIREVNNFIDATQRVVSFISEHPMFRKVYKRNIHEAILTPHNILIYKV